MSEIGDYYKDIEEFSKDKKKSNLEKSKNILAQNKIKFTELSCNHLRVGDYDFWPSTGLFIHIKTKKRERGVFNLVKKILI